jgi:endogenous inhibitor of DNA gyrase (YacG/DUF329 family)
MARRACPVCGKEVSPKESNELFPLCSPRCRLIDLGNWLGEKYRVPGDPIEAGSPAASQPPRDVDPTAPADGSERET